MIERTALKTEIELALTCFRVVELVGPRQSGKTTLARKFVPFDSLNYFDLENPLHLARLDQPMTALQDLRGLVVIDEVQRRPDLFPVLRVLADRTPLPARFLVLGSAAPEWQTDWWGMQARRRPRLTPSIQSALADLHLDHLLVIYPGAVCFPWRTGLKLSRYAISSCLVRYC